MWEFARWKVRNTAIERRDLLHNPLPLMPEFQRSIRLLGRRPTTQQFIDTIIKKYGTHILISATLGGEEALTMYMDKSRLDRKSGNATQSVEALHQLASSYFVDRDGTMRRLHEIQISTGAIKVTETRTGPLGCNSYDNLDSVSSVLLQSTESKLHLQGDLTQTLRRTIQEWLTRVQSLLYCNENGFWGTFLESQRSCVCHGGTSLCQRPIPCIIGGNNSCAMCSLANISLCGSCNKGYKLYRGRCEPQNVDSERSEQFISFETDLDFQDLELKYLLQKMDSRLYVHTTFISNEIRLDTFFDPRWRKRMSLTLKSNKNRMDFIHMVIGISMRICQMRNSSLDPMFFVYVNPFSGSHSEGWNMPFGEYGYPRWEKIRLQNSQCYNWTLLLGNRWKTFFETVHIYLRSRTRLPSLLRNETGQGPVDLSDPTKRQFYIKISDVQVYGYSLRFNADLLRSAVQQVNQSYTQGGQFYSSSSVMLLLLDIRDRINRLAPPVAPGKPQLDLFSCMLKHRLKLTNSEIIRVNHALDLYNTEILKQSDQMTAKLC
ncbi:hypothetical protein llap_10029 [Limosa lapponica baueri]|uniref:BMP/retinoic acid-inducible neural-specific protein 1 n=1 Tax=Limosa lapponica baueri TaxID=1758121 RepID=A0A2I0U0R3_LIMLA|nr:hypothetical protein llap_10029 [Limosa lapponica baueri]